MKYIIWENSSLKILLNKRSQAKIMTDLRCALNKKINVYLRKTEKGTTHTHVVI